GDELVAAVWQPLAQGGEQRRQVRGHAGRAELPRHPARRGVAVIVGRGREREGQRLRVEGGGGRDLLVVEGRADADLRLGVVLRAEVAQDRGALRLAVAGDERLIEECARRLVAAAGGEDGLDQRRGGDDVGRLPGQQRDLQQRVLGGHLGGIRQRLVDVLVDAVDPGLGVGDDLLPYR